LTSVSISLSIPPLTSEGIAPASKLRRRLSNLGRKRMAILQPTQSSVNLLADESPAPGAQVMEESAAASISAETLMDHVEEREGEDEAMTDVSQPESEGPDQEETMMNEAGPSHKGKRVKVGNIPTLSKRAIR